MAEKRPTTSRLQFLARAYTQSSVLFAALDLELFSRVSEGCTSQEDLSSALDLHPLNTLRLVDACVALDLLRRDEDGLVNAPDVERYLVKGKRTYASPWMNFTRPRAADWLNLTEHLQDPQEPSRLGRGVDMSVDEARRYHGATYSVGMGAGRLFCRQVDLSGRRHLLDLGGGSGAYCINAVKSFDGLRARFWTSPAWSK